MKKQANKKKKSKREFIFPEDKKYSFKWFFGSSHLLMGLFAALGVFTIPYYISSFFTPDIFIFLFTFLIIHMWLALDYYYDRSIEKKFLFFFYIFSIIIFLLYFILAFL